MKNELVTKLENALLLCSTIEKYNSLIDAFENDTAACEQKYLRLKHKKVSCVGGNIAIIAVSIIVFCIFLGMAESLFLDNIVITIGVCIIAALGISLPIMNYVAHKAKKQRISKEADTFWKEVGSPTCIKNRDSIIKIQKGINDYMRQNKDIIDFLPPNYSNTNAVLFMLSAVSNYRADSIKEAVNLYEEHLHRLSVERQLEESLYNQQMLESQLQSINDSQAEINTKLRHIEDLQMFDFLLK